MLGIGVSGMVPNYVSIPTIAHRADECRKSLDIQIIIFQLDFDVILRREKLEALRQKKVSAGLGTPRKYVSRG